MDYSGQGDALGAYPDCSMHPSWPTESLKQFESDAYLTQTSFPPQDISISDTDQVALSELPEVAYSLCLDNASEVSCTS